MRKHGFTIDNLLAVGIVTADGALLRASEPLRRRVMQKYQRA
jgi:FAD/FMN-containing dehydrogenase